MLIPNLALHVTLHSLQLIPNIVLLIYTDKNHNALTCFLVKVMCVNEYYFSLTGIYTFSS